MPKVLAGVEQNPSKAHPKGHEGWGIWDAVKYLGSKAWRNAPQLLSMAGTLLAEDAEPIPERKSTKFGHVITKNGLVDQLEIQLKSYAKLKHTTPEFAF